MSVHKKHLQIISEIKCPKSRFNIFGNFHSRNIEDIYAALKPLLIKHGCALKLDNRVYSLEGMIYRESIATLTCIDELSFVTTVSHARETLDHKKMSSEQMSGTCSSYADKYALGKMFLLDDSVDADEIENHGESSKKKEQDERYTLQNEMRKLLKSAGKYSNTSEPILQKMTSEQLETKIKEYRKEYRDDNG